MSPRATEGRMELLCILGLLGVEPEAGLASGCRRLSCFRGLGRASRPAEMGMEDLKPGELLLGCLRQHAPTYPSPMAPHGPRAQS